VIDGCKLSALSRGNRGLSRFAGKMLGNYLSLWRMAPEREGEEFTGRYRN
jgi:hypothetical protein